jgi:membrane-associated protease RseP (regulator of RpoE activity)
MRKATSWPAVSILVLGGWIPLTGVTAGEPAPAERQAAASNPQPASDERMPHRAALGVLMGNSSDGVNIVGLVAGSPAERAGLRVGDVVRFVDDQQVRTWQELTDEIRKHLPGAPIDLTIRRGGQRRIVSATLASEQATFGSRHEVIRVMTAGDEAAVASNAGQASAADRDTQRVRALEQQISRMRQQLNRVPSNLPGQEAKAQEADWGWDDIYNSGHDPAILQ